MVTTAIIIIIIIIIVNVYFTLYYFYHYYYTVCFQIEAVTHRRQSGDRSPAIPVGFNIPLSRAALGGG